MMEALGGAGEVTGAGVAVKGEVYDINLRASSLLFQTFLHHLDTLLLTPDFSVFWLKLLGAIQQRLGGGTGGPLHQHFLESLKNVLLVMRASDVFSEMKERTGQDLYELTMRIIDTFHPEWKEELRGAMREGQSREVMAAEQQRDRERDREREAGQGEQGPVTPVKAGRKAGEELSSPLSVSSFLSEQAQAPREPILQHPSHPMPRVNGVTTPHRPAPSRSPPPQGASVEYPPVRPVDPRGSAAAPLPMPRVVPPAMNGMQPGAAPVVYRPMPPPHLQAGQPPPPAQPGPAPARPLAYTPVRAPSPTVNTSATPLPMMPKVSPPSVHPPLTNGVHGGNPSVVIRFPVRSPTAATANGVAGSTGSACHCLPLPTSAGGTATAWRIYPH